MTILFGPLEFSEFLANTMSGLLWPSFASSPVLSQVCLIINSSHPNSVSALASPKPAVLIRFPLLKQIPVQMNSKGEKVYFGSDF
jgi:hypothetical protein